MNAPVAFVESQAYEFGISPGHFASALQGAPCFQEVKTVKLLLRKGSDVKIQGEPYGNALLAACTMEAIFSETDLDGSVATKKPEI